MALHRFFATCCEQWRNENGGGYKPPPLAKLNRNRDYPISTTTSFSDFILETGTTLP
jgi:hypothetical protein